MSILHLIAGIILAIILWKLIKITFKTIFWLLLIGIVVAFAAPHSLFLVGGIGFFILSVLGTLFVMAIAGFFFLDGD